MAITYISVSIPLIVVFPDFQEGTELLIDSIALLYIDIDNVSIAIASKCCGVVYHIPPTLPGNRNRETILFLILCQEVWERLMLYCFFPGKLVIHGSKHIYTPLLPCLRLLSFFRSRMHAS